MVGVGSSCDRMGRAVCLSASEVWFQYPSNVPESAPIEMTLQPQHQETWYALKSDLLGVATEPMSVKGFVRLGTGREIVSKQKVSVDAKAARI